MAKNILEEKIMTQEELQTYMADENVPKYKRNREYNKVFNRSLMMDDEEKIICEKIRNLVKGFYDIQKLRIACGNRICAYINIQLGQKPGTKQEDMDKESEKIIRSLRKDYNRITDGYTYHSKTIKKRIAELEENKEISYIKDIIDFNLMKEYMDLVALEDDANNIVEAVVKTHPLYNSFFKPILGCGPLMAAVCLSYFDPYKARHASNFVSYAGLNPVNKVEENGDIKVIANSKHYTEMREFVNKDGKVDVKKSLTYEPFLRTKLIGVLAGCITKASIRSVKAMNPETGKIEDTGDRIVEGKYANEYINYKMRKLNQGFSKSHANRMAVRHMLKLFVIDLWVAWRELEGLPVSVPYEVDKLGMEPHMSFNQSDKVLYKAADLAACVDLTDDEEDE